MVKLTSATTPVEVGHDVKLRNYKITDTYEVTGGNGRYALELAVRTAITNTTLGLVDELGEVPEVKKVSISWQTASPTVLTTEYYVTGNYGSSPIAPLILLLAAAVTIAIVSIVVGTFVLTPLTRIAEEVGPLPFILGGAALLILALVLLGGKKKKKGEKS